MSRIERFEEALNRCKLALANEPSAFPLEWVIEQLKYLIELEINRTTDIANLKNISIGWIAARELDGFEDKELIHLLCSIAEDVKQMALEKLA